MNGVGTQTMDGKFRVQIISILTLNLLSEVCVCGGEGFIIVLFLVFLLLI